MAETPEGSGIREVVFQHQVDHLNTTGRIKGHRSDRCSGSTAANPKPITREDVEYLLREIF